MPSMFRSGGVDCRGRRLGRWIDCVRRDACTLAQAAQSGALVFAAAVEEAGLTLDHLLRRSHSKLGPVELLLEGVKDIVVDRALTA